MKKGLKVFAKVLIVIFVIGTIPNYYSLMYKFGKSKKFTGDVFYNPYKDINGKWIKANFHAHTKAYKGITNGENSAEEMLHKYDSLKFDLACISNYNFIQDSTTGYRYFPVYEHGINVRWVHQQVMNAKESKPFDYPFIQLRSNKQFIIDRLKTEGNLLTLNHPGQRSSYLNRDLRYLNNYNFIEGLSSLEISVNKWDEALSSGHAVWILGNDDSHDLSDYHTGICWNMIHVDSVISRKAIMDNLKKGACYATKGWLGQEMNRPVSVKVEDGVYKLQLRNKADSVILRSDYGKLVAVDTSVNFISYKIQPEDSYIRAEIFETEWWNGYTKMYLNPVIRTSEGNLTQHNNINSISYFRSIIYWLSLFIMQLLLIRIVRKW